MLMLANCLKDDKVLNVKVRVVWQNESFFSRDVRSEAVHALRLVDTSKYHCVPSNFIVVSGI